MPGHDYDLDPPNHSSYDGATQGPDPVPEWVVTNVAAVDTELGLLKSGKEADVHLVRRAVPADAGSLLAAKRYRPAERRLFHRDVAYQEGRRVRRSRENRAMTRRTEFGRELLAGQWAAAEFSALSMLWRAGAPVPYPVQLSGTELMLEFIGDEDGRPAPRLAQCRPAPSELADLFEQCRDAMRHLARTGYAHGDLSPYNMLVDRGRLVLIDLPQVVDLVANPQGQQYLRRDCFNVCRWFRARGLSTVEYEYLFDDLMGEAVNTI
ncbi:MAG TPA: RIO1 family regulatory kinase/ATPase [Jatrophihabitantaceae bacterium]